MNSFEFCFFVWKARLALARLLVTTIQVSERKKPADRALDVPVRFAKKNSGQYWLHKDTPKVSLSLPILYLPWYAKLHLHFRLL
jgi:hypothetical protein